MPNSSQAADAHSLSDEDLERMVADAVFYLLVADQKKAPIKVTCISHPTPV